MLKAYRDVAGHWSIGYGHTGDVKRGMKISTRKAEALFRRDVEEAEASVKRKLKVPVTQDEFSALVMLVYNIGPSAFARSSVLRELNRGNKHNAANAFMMWDMVRIDNHPVENAYLKKYRKIERDFFLGAEADSVPYFAVYPIPLPIIKPTPVIIREKLPAQTPNSPADVAQEKDSGKPAA
jgi:lysozyme